MDFLDKLVIPLSPEHITLLQYIAMLILFLFIPFISIIIGGTTLSLYYKTKGIKEGNNNYVRFAKDIIEIVTINKSIGLVLGIMTLITAILIFVQLFHGANLIVVSYIVGALFLISVGLILIYTFRYSSSFNEFFNAIKDFQSNDKNLLDELTRFRKGSLKLSLGAGRFGFVFIVLGSWLLISGLTSAIFQTDLWNRSVLSVMFSWIVIARFIPFLLTAGAFTGAALLFSFFYWEGGRKNLDDDYKNFVRNVCINLTSVTSVIIPVFYLIQINGLPINLLNWGIFIYITIALLLLFLGYHYLYVMYKDSSTKYSLHIFIVILLVIFSGIISDQSAVGTANQKQALILSQNFEEVMQQLNGENAVTTISGEDIYKNICSACHSFDHKVVGPPYNETLPKYNGNVDKLVTFILNPTQNNPGYPPMPNPGLQPAQAKAVAQYILTEVKKYL